MGHAHLANKLGAGRGRVWLCGHPQTVGSAHSPIKELEASAMFPTLVAHVIGDIQVVLVVCVISATATK